MNSKKDPMGRAIAEYWKTNKADRLRVFSPMFEEDEIPLTTLFRSYEDMPEIERKTLDMAKGRILDVGVIHGLTWACFAKNGWKSISFGVWWKVLTPYCHCNEPMPIPNYMIAAMMPCIVLGVIPAVVALFIGSLPMLAWGIFFIAAAAGDIWMTWLLTKENPKSMVLDHPSEAGFYIID